MSTHLIEDAVCVMQTPHAICVQAPCFDEDIWIPQSMVHDDSEVYEEGHEGDLVVKLYWADKQGWV